MNINDRPDKNMRMLVYILDRINRADLEADYAGLGCPVGEDGCSCLSIDDNDIEPKVINCRECWVRWLKENI